MKCLECGKDIEEGMSKCPNCGRILSDDFELDLPVLKEEKDEVENEEQDLEKTRSIFALNETQELNLLDDINKYIDKTNEEAKKEKEQNEEKVSDTEEVEEKEIKDSEEEEDKVEEEKVEEESEDEKEVTLSDEEEPEDKDSEDSTEMKEKSSKAVEIQKSDEPSFILKTKQSIKDRKQVLTVMTICFGIVILGMLLSIYFIRDKNPNSTNGTYIVNMETALNEYFNNYNIDKVVFVLEDVKKDEEKVKDVQRITKITCDGWMEELINRDIATPEEYDEITDKYRRIINGLHEDAIVKYDNEYVKALGDIDYEDLIKQVDDITNDGSGFFDALTMYNVKDYNKAYYLFQKITEDNAYYDRAQEYLDRIVSNVVDILKTDIRKVELGIDSLSEDEKLKKYIQIEEIILAYRNTYMTLELEKKDKYMEVLNDYREKIGNLGNDNGVLANTGL